jgi:hypothetical protein
MEPPRPILGPPDPEQSNRDRMIRLLMQQQMLAQPTQPPPANPSGMGNPMIQALMARRLMGLPPQPQKIPQVEVQDMPEGAPL